MTRRFWTLLVAIPVLSAACSAGSVPNAGPLPANATDAGGYPLEFVVSDADQDRAAGITRYVRFRHGVREAYGVLEGHNVRELDGTLFDHKMTRRTYPLTDVELLAPIAPRDVPNAFGIAINFRVPNRPEEHHPRFFAKLSSTISGPDDGIELPAEATNLNYEGEISMIIGRGGRNIPVERAMDHVFGVTIINDWSENTWYGERQSFAEPTRLISKGHDSWQSLGPTLVRGIDFSDLEVKVRLNGDLVTQGRVTDYAYGPAQAIAYISQYITLQPGDIIALGTFYPPVEGARRVMQLGDVTEVEIENIGILRNTIVPAVTEYRIID